MTTQEVSAVIQACDEGKTIQFRRYYSDNGSEWVDILPRGGRFALNFYSYDYRVKPEPREFWAAFSERYKGPLRESLERAKKDAFENGSCVVHLREDLK